MCAISLVFLSFGGHCPNKIIQFRLCRGGPSLLRIHKIKSSPPPFARLIKYVFAIIFFFNLKPINIEKKTNDTNKRVFFHGHPMFTAYRYFYMTINCTIFRYLHENQHFIGAISVEKIIRNTIFYNEQLLNFRLQFFFIYYIYVRIYGKL